MAILFVFINILLAVLVIAGVVSGVFFAWFYLIAVTVLTLMSALDS